ncbi:hypothetical protein [Brevirhabdus sp.]
MTSRSKRDAPPKTAKPEIPERRFRSNANRKPADEAARPEFIFTDWASI